MRDEAGFWPRTALASTMLLAILLATTGCAGMLGVLAPAVGFAGESTPTAADSVDSPASPQRGAPVGDGEVDGEINDAVDVVGTFWSDHYSDYYSGAQYRPPTVGGAYSADDPPSCGGEQLEPFNAYYCIADNTLWWDEELMKAANEAGDAVVYLVVAHEWGHAIQAQIEDVWVAEELQADCFAAAALYGAAEDNYLVWEEGDTAEITNGLTALSDETAWTDSGDHGDPLDRIAAFNDGRVGGVPGCFTVEGQ